MLRKAVEALKRHLRATVTVSGLVGFIVVTFFSGPISDAGSASVNYVWDRFFPRPGILRFDFNASRGCSQGKLADIRKSFEYSAIALENGAEMLVVCDTQSLRTTKARAPRDLSIRFPGCLVERGESLVMVRKAEAVCSLPGDKGFVCDGAKGRKRAPGKIGDPADHVSPCSADILRQFGFS